MEAIMDVVNFRRDLRCALVFSGTFVLLPQTMRWNICLH